MTLHVNHFDKRMNFVENTGHAPRSPQRRQNGSPRGPECTQTSTQKEPNGGKWSPKGSQWEPKFPPWTPQGRPRTPQIRPSTPKGSEMEPAWRTSAAKFGKIGCSLALGATFLSKFDKNITKSNKTS